MTKLKRKQYCWTMDEHSKGYCCIFEYVRENEKLTDRRTREGVFLRFSLC